VVFQSNASCSLHGLRGVFAATLDGAEVFRVSPKREAQCTLRRVTPGPPAIVYFSSNFETGGDRVCYAVPLSLAPIPQPTRVSEELCRALQ
jgi:hypothetical protein